MKEKLEVKSVRSTLVRTLEFDSSGNFRPVDSKATFISIGAKSNGSPVQAIHRFDHIIVMDDGVNGRVAEGLEQVERNNGPMYKPGDIVEVTPTPSSQEASS